MENRVGDHVPSEATVDKLVAEVDGIGDKTEKYTVSLTPDERQRALKMPGGGEDIARLIAKLMRKHDVSLPGISPEDIEADLVLATRLAPLAEALATRLRRVQDGILEAESECWYATTAGYTALARLAGGDAKLAHDLKPAMDFFGVGKKRKKAAAKTG
jgi:hypothetical protein